MSFSRVLLFAYFAGCAALLGAIGFSSLSLLAA